MIFFCLKNTIASQTLYIGNIFKQGLFFGQIWCAVHFRFVKLTNGFAFLILFHLCIIFFLMNKIYFIKNLKCL